MVLKLPSDGNGSELPSSTNHAIEVLLDGVVGAGSESGPSSGIGDQTIA